LTIEPDKQGQQCAACGDNARPPDPVFDLCRLQQYDKALDICRTKIAEAPSDAVGYRRMGDVLQLMKKFAEALPYRNKVVELRPDCVASYFSRADLFYEMGDYTAAIPDFTRAAALDHEEAFGPVNFLYRADCHRRLGNYDQALADCALVPDGYDFPGFLGVRGGGKELLLAEIARQRGHS
jgi:tetratricopeptide (TPR) repeat protein